MSTLYDGFLDALWLLVKVGTDGWVKPFETPDKAIEEFVVCTQVKKDTYLKIVKITPNGSLDNNIHTVTLDREQIWKRAFGLHEVIKNRLVLEKANADKAKGILL